MLKYLCAAALPLTFLACEKEVIVTAAPESPPPVVEAEYRVDGYVQKGPFLNGTAMKVSELDSTLVPTGKTFTTQLLDNRGSFELRGVTLASSYVQLQADGFYYNEVSDEKSDAQLTLFALTDLREHSQVNVNLLSHLEKTRVEYLMGQGSPFDAAKQQAQAELLALFEIDAANMVDAEQLDITQEGEGHAALLAVSMILQGDLSVAEFSEFLADISTDLRTDGTLDSKILQYRMLRQAVNVDAEQIRQHLIARYLEMGVAIKVPDFGAVVDNFIAKTPFALPTNFTYPATVNGHRGPLPSLLHSTETVLSLETEYGAAVVLPEYASVRLEVTAGSGVDIGSAHLGPSHKPDWKTDWERTEPYDPNKPYTIALIADEVGENVTGFQFAADTNRVQTADELYVSFKLYENLSDSAVWEQRFELK